MTNIFCFTLPPPHEKSHLQLRLSNHARLHLIMITMRQIRNTGVAIGSEVRGFVQDMQILAGPDRPSSCKVSGVCCPDFAWAQVIRIRSTVQN